jgi:hypothetical protein
MESMLALELGRSNKRADELVDASIGSLVDGKYDYNIPLPKLLSVIGPIMYLELSDR